MKEKQNWIKYNPTNIKFEGAYSAFPKHTEEGIKFVIDCEDGNNLEVSFDGFIPAYNYAIEGLKIETWGLIQQQNNDKSFFKKWFLYKIENSDFLKCSVEESGGYYLEEELSHYCIVTQSSLIDILATSKPKITIL